MVKLFTNGQCPRCSQLFDYLTKKDLKVELVNLMDERPNYQPTTRALPLISVNDEEYVPEDIMDFYSIYEFLKTKETSNEEIV